jgi:hypothetical protein
MTVAATERAVEATKELLRAREACAAAEASWERAVVGMHIAGVAKTKVHACLHAGLREARVEVKDGDGLSGWTIRNILDSGRHRG